MKKNLWILTALVVVLVCLTVAIVYSNDRQARATAATSSAVQNLKAELKNERVTSIHKSQVNELSLKNAGDQIIVLTAQKTTLCTTLKTNKLTSPLCL